MNYAERYIEMLRGRGMEVGQLVVCQYRHPTPHQWWLHPFWVGVIEMPGTDPKDWNGHTSEAYYCCNLHAVRVQYLPGEGGMGGTHAFMQHDSLANLQPVASFTTEKAYMTKGDLEKSPYFGHPGGLETVRELEKLVQFAARVGMAGQYAPELREMRWKVDQEMRGMRKGPKARTA